MPRLRLKKSAVYSLLVDKGGWGNPQERISQRRGGTGQFVNKWILVFLHSEYIFDSI